MTTGQKISAQLDELDAVREGLIGALEDKGAVIDPNAKLEEVIEKIEDLDVNDGYRFTKLGLSPINKTSYLDYQEELNKVDFRNFGLDGLFSGAYLTTMPDFSNCKNINTVTTANKTFQQAVLQGASTSKPFIVGNLPSTLTSLNNAFENVVNIDLTGASFPNIVSASKIFCYDNINQKPTNLNLINHDGSNFDNITDASYFYSNRQLIFYNQDLTKFTDTINGTSFSGTIYTLKNKTFQNLTSAQYFQFNYFMSSQKAVKIENCNFPNLVNLSYAFAGMSSDGGSGVNNGITHFYIKNCTFGKPLNLSYIFSRRYALANITIDCENRIPVSNMEGAFGSLSNITSIPFESFDVSSCSNFKSVMSYCSKLTSIDLTSWHTDSASLQYAFSYCSQATSIKIPNIKLSLGNYQDSAFSGCSSLQHLDIRNCQYSLVRTSVSSLVSGVPTTCEIIVKDDTEKTWWNTKYPKYTNIKTADEYEAEQNNS